MPGGATCERWPRGRRQRNPARPTRSFAAVGELIDAIQSDQWSAPTPCLDWTVHRLVEHLVGKNLVFTAVLAEQPPPQG